LGRVAPIHELRTDEESDERSEIEGVQDHRLLPGRVEAEAWQIAEIKFKPRSPDEELEEHHNRQFDQQTPGELRRNMRRRPLIPLCHANLRVQMRERQAAMYGRNTRGATEKRHLQYISS